MSPDLNIALLHRLRAAGGAAVPLAELGGEPVVRDLEALAAFGFDVAWDPTRGAVYRGPAARLCPDQIEWALNTRRIGRRVAVWGRVGSTNDLAARASASTANDGLVVLAEGQTAGRGRRGRSWTAPEGSAVLMSVLLFPPHPLDDPAWLTALGAVAAAEVVEARTGRPAGIKWPNDVRVGGRKVAGVLVERAGGAVLGLGLNVNAAAGDFPPELRESASSLRRLSGGAAHDRSEVARDLIRRLDAHYVAGLERGPGPLAAAWRARFEPLGRRVRVETPDGSWTGVLVEADLRLGLTLAPDGAPPLVLPGPAVRAVAVAEADGPLAS